MGANLGTKPHHSKETANYKEPCSISKIFLLPFSLWTSMPSIKLHELSRWAFLVPTEGSDSCPDTHIHLYAEMICHMMKQRF